MGKFASQLSLASCPRYGGMNARLSQNTSVGSSVWPKDPRQRTEGGSSCRTGGGLQTKAVQGAAPLDWVALSEMCGDLARRWRQLGLWIGLRGAYRAWAEVPPLCPEGVGELSQESRALFSGGRGVTHSCCPRSDRGMGWLRLQREPVQWVSTPAGSGGLH